ncbi:MAG TPA: protein-L-isoaspartate(D-aspartate) O-methyltransferase, partial [Hyphomicrobiales bacterium]|nr:protein-L-isoaspartate(D-aspartate) O-methyltransferase [Hyphomicrobiales bacterium]
LSAIEKVPRHLFVSPAFEAQSYADTSLPIECGQTISQPFVVAYMTELLNIGDRDKVLEIGTGSGYQAAVLSHLARRVYTIERYRTLAREAGERFADLGLSNITGMVGDGMRGWPEQAPFDRIIVTAAAEEVPDELQNQLKDGGIMVLPVGPAGGVQHIVRVMREGDNFVHEQKLAVRFVPLVKGRAQQL